jgi:hypothetical protein
VDGDAAGGEGREEGAVAAEMVTKAVDKDELGFNGTLGLKGC